MSVLRPYTNRQGQPITASEWGVLHNESEYCRVDETYVGPYRISTVWLGVDYGIKGREAAAFETLLFGRGDFEMGERYYTEVEAVKGHEKWVSTAKTWTDPDFIRGLVAELVEIEKGLEAL